MPGPPSVPGNAPQFMAGAEGSVDALQDDNGQYIRMEVSKYADVRLLQYQFNLPLNIEIESVSVHYEALVSTNSTTGLSFRLLAPSANSDNIPASVTSESPTVYETIFSTSFLPAGFNAEEINNPDFGLQIVLSTAGVQIDFDYINLEIKYITREGKLQISQGQVELTSGKFNL